MPTRTNVVQYILRKEQFQSFLEARGEVFPPTAKFYILGNSNIVRDDEFYFVASDEVVGTAFNRLNKQVFQFTTLELRNFINANGGSIPPAAIFYVKPIAWNPDNSVKENIIVITLDSIVHRL